MDLVLRGLPNCRRRSTWETGADAPWSRDWDGRKVDDRAARFRRVGMSDISINPPLWFLLIFLSAKFWPVVLVMFVLVIGLSLILRGKARAAALVLATLMSADLMVAAVFLIG